MIPESVTRATRAPAVRAPFFTTPACLTGRLEMRGCSDTRHASLRVARCDHLIATALLRIGAASKHAAEWRTTMISANG